MTPERVYRETVPYDLALRAVMLDAEHALLSRHNRLVARESELARVKHAADMLSPKQPDDEFVSSQFRESRLLVRAWEAFGVPENGTANNVRALLGRTSIILQNLSEGKSEGSIDVEFAENALGSMRVVATTHWAHPSDEMLA